MTDGEAPSSAIEQVEIDDAQSDGAANVIGCESHIIRQVGPEVSPEVTPEVSRQTTIIGRALYPFVAALSDHLRAVSDGSSQRRCSGDITNTATSFSAGRSSELLRATTLSVVLRSCGQILKSSKGTAKTFRLSRQVDWIDIFISHNWSVPRWKKFRALALEFNLLPAIASGFICALIGCVLNWFGLPPKLRLRNLQGNHDCMGIYSEVLGMIGFTVVVTQWRVAFPCRSDLRVFLDKVCIHQTNAELKAKGIEKLGAFLRHSNCMLVLFTGLYCRQLWTIYELACFLLLHPAKDLRLVPVGVSCAVLRFIFFFWVTYLGYAILVHSFAHQRLMHTLVSGLLTLLTTTYVAYSVRAWIQELRVTMKDLREFSFDRARCFVESDRELVRGIISSFMKFMKLAPEDADDAVALAAFESYVKERMPGAVQKVVGNVGFPYRFILLLGLPWDFFVLDVVSTRQSQGFDKMFILPWLIYGVSMHTVTIPTVVLVVTVLCRRVKLRESRAGEMATTLAIALIGAATYGGAYALATTLRARAHESPSWAVGFAAIVVLLALCAALPHFNFNNDSELGPMSGPTTTRSVLNRILEASE